MKSHSQWDIPTGRETIPGILLANSITSHHTRAMQCNNYEPLYGYIAPKGTSLSTTSNYILITPTKASSVNKHKHHYNVVAHKALIKALITTCFMFCPEVYRLSSA